MAAQHDADDNLSAVDLFSGCGGMSLGFQNAGYDVEAAFDNWKPAIEVYRANFDHPIYQQDLSDVDAAVEAIEDYCPTVIFGGPPCQDFSTAGHQDENGGRAVLSVAFARIVTTVRSEWFVMENVATIKNTKSFKTVCKLFRDAGYGLTCRVLNAAYCGVPQTRKRMFIIGGLGESEGFLDSRLEARLAEKPMTIRDYLGNSLGIENYFRVPTNYSRRGVFSIDEPSMTIRAIDRPVPPGYKGNPKDSAPVSETRVLTPKERSYIQTFPRDFEFFGGKSDINTMIGNAVPVNLAYYVASALADYINAESEVQ
ncbi:DNA cytosine methyltransferase [Caniella muris]|uniref:DNA cytosine methyltransferase n=1 Tax=Caniella muris TaxID=2941502 RepID=UPI0020403B90|nr:DNA cytosine methyltransferase [Caniella muris]